MDSRAGAPLGVEPGTRGSETASRPDCAPPARGPATGPTCPAELAERLHDGPLQDLAAIDLKLAALQNVAPASLAAELGALRSLAESASDALRMMLGETVAAPARSDLAAQLRELCTAFTSESGIHVDVVLDEAHLTLDGAIGDLVYRSIRELLTNVRKHSRAERAWLSSARDPSGDVVFSVADDGSGISAERVRSRIAVHGRGFGLWSIEHRVRSFGGRMELEVDGGLRVTIVLPRDVVRGTG